MQVVTRWLVIPTAASLKRLFLWLTSQSQVQCSVQGVYLMQLPYWVQCHFKDRSKKKKDIVFFFPGSPLSCNEDYKAILIPIVPFLSSHRHAQGALCIYDLTHWVTAVMRWTSLPRLVTCGVIKGLLASDLTALTFFPMCAVNIIRSFPKPNSKSKSFTVGFFSVFGT